MFSLCRLTDFCIQKHCRHVTPSRSEELARPVGSHTLLTIHRTHNPLCEWLSHYWSRQFHYGILMKKVPYVIFLKYDVKNFTRLLKNTTVQVGNETASGNHYKYKISRSGCLIKLMKIIPTKVTKIFTYKRPYLLHLKVLGIFLWLWLYQFLCSQLYLPRYHYIVVVVL